MITLFAITAALTLFWTRPYAASKQSTLTLPETLGDWKKASDVSFEDRILRILGTDDVTSAIYENAGRHVNVVIVRAINNRSAFHPPEYCLTGGGSEITRKGVAPEAFAANEMEVTARNSRNMLVWNWYRAGSRETDNFYRQQLWLLRDQVMTGKSSGAAINIYTDMGGGDIETARAAAGDFTRALRASLQGTLSL